MADIETNRAMNDDYYYIYFDSNFPNVKLHPYDVYKNMSTLKSVYTSFEETKKNIKMVR
jgi:hypothetical protein